MVPINGYFDFSHFSFYWSGEAPIDIKLDTQEDQVKSNTSAKNCAPGMFLQEGICGGNIPSVNWLLTLLLMYIMYCSLPFL